MPASMLKSYWVTIPKGVSIKFLKTKTLTQILVIYLDNIYIFNLGLGELLVLYHKNLLFFSPYSNSLKLSSYVILQNILRGFLFSWKVGLSLHGVGFKFIKVTSNCISVKLGYSHTITYFLPKNVLIKISSKRPTRILLSSFNKSTLGKVSNIIKKMRNPDAYKAKGIQFFKEIVVLKKREKFGVI